VVVLDFGGGLAVVRAEDAVGVLDKPSLLRDGRGEEICGEDYPYIT